MSIKHSIALAAAGAVALGGCGTDTQSAQVRRQATEARQHVQQQTDKAREKVRQQRAKARKDVPPAARGVLEDAQKLTGDVTTTVRRYAAHSASREQTRTILEREQQRAEALGRRAQALPAADSARSPLMRLTDNLQRTTGKVRGSIGSSGGDKQVQRSADDLRKAAQQAYQDLEKQLPADVRKRISDALAALGG